MEYKENGEIIKYKSKPEELDYDFYLTLAKNKKVVAIGECGLDYSYNPENQNLNLSADRQDLKSKNWKEKQKEVFIKHLELAKEVNKPIIIHCRDAHKDLLEIISAFNFPPSANLGVMHFLPAHWSKRKNILTWDFMFLFPVL